MKTKITIGFDITDDEAYSDHYRCNYEDPFIEDYSRGRTWMWKLNYIAEGGTGEDFKKALEADVSALLEKQNREIWVTGYGYVDKDKVTGWLKFKGLLKRLVRFRISTYRPSDEIPF